MKAIMDYDRQPKPAWFAYRDALTPLAVSLRTDRRAFFAGEPLELEAWVCNDLHDAPAGAKLHYQLECEGKVLQTGSTVATVPVLDSAYQGTLRFQTPELESRTTVTARLGLLDAGGRVLHDTAIDLDVFPRCTGELRRIYVLGGPKGKAAQLAGDLGAEPVFEGPIHSGDSILVDDLQAFGKVEVQVAEAVRAGALAVFLELPGGKHRIAGTEVDVGGTPTGLHFVSRDTGHRLVAGFQPEDFKFWYDARVERPTPLLKTPGFRAGGWGPVLLTHNVMAAGCKPEGKGCWHICQVELAGRTAGNAVATIFARRLLEKPSSTGLKGRAR